MTQPTPPYRVERLEEIVLPDPSGRISQVTRVHYILPNGYIGVISLPKHKVTPEEVLAALEPEVARVMAIYGLRPS